MSGRLWPYIGRATFDSADVRDLSAGGALLLDDACRRAPNLGGYLIGRSMLAFPDNVRFGPDEQLAYRNGSDRALEMFNRYPVKLSARMGCNEPGVKTLEVARLQGAFEAGVGDVCWRMGEDYVGGNWACGNPELDGDPTHAAIVVEWLRTYRKWSPRSKLVIGYHGYRKSENDALALADATWYERRPFDWWKPAILAAGLDMPDVIMTESGFDAGPVENNEYRDRLGSERYAAYLRGLPLVPECRAFCLYLYTTVDPAKWASFDYSDDAVVKSAIRETNAKGETPMATNDLAHEIWDECWRWRDRPGAAGYNPNTAIGHYREINPGYGMPLSAEFDGRVGSAPWSVVIQVFAGGVILARKGDWKTMGARSEAELRDVIRSPLAP